MCARGDVAIARTIAVNELSELSADDANDCCCCCCWSERSDRVACGSPCGCQRLVANASGCSDAMRLSMRLERASMTLLIAERKRERKRERERERERRKK